MSNRSTPSRARIGIYRRVSSSSQPWPGGSQSTAESLQKRGISVGMFLRTIRATSTPKRMRFSNDPPHLSVRLFAF